MGPLTVVNTNNLILWNFNRIGRKRNLRNQVNEENIILHNANLSCLPIKCSDKMSYFVGVGFRSPVASEWMLYTNLGKMRYWVTGQNTCINSVRWRWKNNIRIWTNQELRMKSCNILWFDNYKSKTTSSISYDRSVFIGPRGIQHFPNCAIYVTNGCGNVNFCNVHILLSSHSFNGNPISNTI